MIRRAQANWLLALGATVAAAGLFWGGSRGKDSIGAQPSSPPSTPPPGAVVRTPSPATSTPARPSLPPVPEGAAVHTVIEYFERLGPALPQVRAASGYAVEERTVRESWVQAGPGGVQARSRVVIRSPGGSVLSRHEYDGQVASVRLPDGSIAQAERPDGQRPVQAPIGALSLPQPAAAAALQFAELSRRAAARLSQVQGTGGEALPTITETYPYLAEPIGGEGYSLPYVEDLKPRQLEYIWTFTPAKDRLLVVQTFAIDSTGRRQLVAETRTLEEEVIPAGQIPAGVLPTAGRSN